MQHRGFLVIIFVIGCATGGVASQLVVPAARAGTTLTRWEYLSGPLDVDTMSSVLNQAGVQGWELVTIYGNIFFAKRAL
jgi:hypothetical protein